MSVHQVVETKACLPILIYFYVYGSASKGRLTRCLRFNWRTVRKALVILEELEVVDSYADSSFPFERRYALSKRGRELLETRVYEWPALFLRWTGERLTAPEVVA